MRVTDKMRAAIRAWFHDEPGAPPGPAEHRLRELNVAWQDKQASDMSRKWCSWYGHCPCCVRAGNPQVGDERTCCLCGPIVVG